MKIIATNTDYTENVPNGTIMTVCRDYNDGDVLATVDGGDGLHWFMDDGTYEEYTPRHDSRENHFSAVKDNLTKPQWGTDMTQIHVVFPDGDTWPVAAFTNRGAAEKACGILDVQTRVQHWIADLTISESLDQFLEQGK